MNENFINKKSEDLLKKLEFRGRGIFEYSIRIDNVLSDVEKILMKKKKVKVLEIGCGYGTALLQLLDIYDSRVKLYGINKKPTDGNLEILKSNSDRLGLDLNIEDIKIIHLDLDIYNGIPFPNSFFDIIISQSSFMYFRDKLGILREVRRILATEGIAKIHPSIYIEENPETYRSLFQVWKSGKLLNSWKYISSLPGVELNYSKHGKKYICIESGSDWKHKYQLVGSLDMYQLSEQYSGTVSFYRCC